MRRRASGVLALVCAAGCAAAPPAPTPEEARLTGFLRALAAVEQVTPGRGGEGEATGLAHALRALATPGEVMRAVDWLDQTRALIARESEPLQRSQAHVLGCGAVVLRCETDHLSRTLHDAAVAPAPIEALVDALGDPDFRVAAKAAEDLEPPWNGPAARTFLAACVRGRDGAGAAGAARGVAALVHAAAALVEPEPTPGAAAEALHGRLDLFLPARERVASLARAPVAEEPTPPGETAKRLKQRLADLAADRADARSRELAALPDALAAPALSAADRLGVLRRLLADPMSAREVATALAGDVEGAGLAVRRVAGVADPAVHGAVLLAFPTESGLPVLEALLPGPDRVRAAFRAALADAAIRVRVEAARRWLAVGWTLGAYDPRRAEPAALTALDAPAAGAAPETSLDGLHRVMEKLGILVGAYRRAREVENARAKLRADREGAAYEPQQTEPGDLATLTASFPAHRWDDCAPDAAGGFSHAPTGWRLVLARTTSDEARVVVARPPAGAPGEPCWFDPVAGLVRSGSP